MTTPRSWRVGVLEFRRSSCPERPGPGRLWAGAIWRALLALGVGAHAAGSVSQHVLRERDIRRGNPIATAVLQHRLDVARRRKWLYSARLSDKRPWRRGALMPSPSDVASRTAVRKLADQAFARAVGASLVGGNSIRLLEDARENYPAWLDAIAGARRSILFETRLRADFCLR